MRHQHPHHHQPAHHGPHHTHHAPHHPHMHHNRRRMGESMVGKPDDTLSSFLSDPQEYQWVLSKIINEGPPSKQVRNAMIIKQLSEFVKMVSAVTGKTPMAQGGIEIQSDDPESEDYTYPVQLPEAVLSGIRNSEEVIEWMEEGPAHDVLRDVLMMAVINWGKEAFKARSITI